MYRFLRFIFGGANMKVWNSGIFLAVLSWHCISANPNERVKPRNMHGACEILINEVFLGAQSYVEIGKLCPSNPTFKNKRVDLNGYVLLVIEYKNTEENGEQLICKQAVKLESVELKPSIITVKNPTAPFTPGRKSPSPAGVPDPTVVTANAGIGLNGPNDHRQLNTEFFRVVNLQSKGLSNGMVAIMLLHLNAAEKRRSLPCNINEAVTDGQIVLIRTVIHDAVFIAHSRADINEKLLTVGPASIDPFIQPKAELLKPDHSYSKCDINMKTFNHEGFKFTKKSPEEPNICPLSLGFILSVQFTPPFGPFKGKLINTQAMQLAINLARSLKFYRGNKKVLDMEPIKLAAKLLNIGGRTITRAEARLSATGSLARSKPRKAFSKVMCGFNDDQKAILYETITSFYSQNLVPTLRPMYDRFVAKVKESQPSEEAERFRCGLGTFRKMLKLEDYKYATVNHRDAVLFNPDKVRWRSRYLSIIRENDVSSQYEKVYLDETWSDTKSVVKKGWVRSCYATFAERRDFAMAKYTPGKGRRLIIMAAGNENGFINESIFVRKISKDAIGDDYHTNLNANAFEKWFLSLLDSLDKASSKKFYIIMDNAPSHSVVTIRSNANKAEMIEWIKKQKDDGHDVPEGFEGMLNVELKKIIRKLKEETSYHKLDDITKARGHRIVRIPPFNCDLNPIEEVWKDIKHSLKVQNVDQNIDNHFERAKQILYSYPKEKWASHVNHIKKLEQQYFDGDVVFDEFLGRNPELEEQYINNDVQDIELDDDNDMLDTEIQEETASQAQSPTEIDSSSDTDSDSADYQSDMAYPGETNAIS